MAPLSQRSRRRTHLRLCAIFLLLLGIFTPTQRARAATRYYVNDNAAAGGNGLAWGTAFRYLQDALSSADPGDEIWVAAGVYYPDLSSAGGDTNDITASFLLESGVALYGGFAGNEGQLSQRNVAVNVTVLSGDITDNDTTDGNEIVTDPANILAPNVWHVVIASGVTTGARLDGFTITAGNAIGGGTCDDDCGGGLYADNGGPTLANLTFRGNRGSYGGAMLFRNPSSTPTFVDVVIRNNRGVNYGGGMQVQDGANVTLNRVQLIENEALLRGGGIYIHLAGATLVEVLFDENSANDGGGLYNFTSSPILNNVTFSDNKVVYGGGVYNFGSNPSLTNVDFIENSATASGGGIYNDGSSPVLTDVTFSSNLANYGGGIFNTDSNPSLTDVIFSGNRANNGGGGMINLVTSDAILTNVIFSGNYAGNGGGIYNFGSRLNLTNVTFSGNQVTDFGGGIYNFNSNDLLLQNTIIWDNFPQSITSNSSTPTFRHSLVQGLLPTGGSNVGNLDGTNPANAPRFVTAVNCGDDGCTDNPATIGIDEDESANDDYGDLHLQAGSPAVDVGDNAADLDGDAPGATTIADIATDLGGQPRIVAAKLLPATVDLGAYEAAPFPPNANTGGPYTTNEGSALALNASASTDDFGIVTYGWDCTNNNSIDSTSNAPTGKTCFYPNSGSHTLRLTVTDNLNATNTATTTVTVANVPPAYTPDPNQSTTAGNAKSFTLGSFSDPGAEGTWSVTVDWGDDSTPTQFTVNSPGALSAESHVYAMQGTYNVVVTVNDDVDNDNGGFQVVVNAASPDAPIVNPASNQAANSGTEKSFALGSFSDPGSAGPWQITINWGDGSPEILFSVMSGGDIPAKSHTYAAAGEYEVSVTISDGVLSASATFIVTISGQAEEGAKIYLPTARKP